jgi:hypothetical protein
MNNAKNNKKIIELTSKYLFNHQNSNIDIIITTIIKKYQDDQQQQQRIDEINKLDQDINLIRQKFDEFNPKGTDGVVNTKINSFINTYKFKLKDNNNFLKDSSTIINHIISPDYGKTREALNKTKKIDEGSSWPFTIFKTSEWQQVAGKFNDMIDQNTQLNNQLINNRIVIENLQQTKLKNNAEIDRLNKEASTNNTRIAENNTRIANLQEQQTKIYEQLIREARLNDTLQTTLAKQDETIAKLQITLYKQKQTLEANNTIKEQAQAAATAAQRAAEDAQAAAEKAKEAARQAKADAKAEAEAAQTAAKKAQTEAAVAKADAKKAQTEAAEAKAKAEAAQEAQTRAEQATATAEQATATAEQATATAEQATATAEKAKADADKQLTEMREKIEQYTEANKELMENKASKQAEIDILNKKINNTWEFLKNQTATHQEALEKQKVAQQQQIEELKNQHKTQISWMKQSLILKVNEIKEIEAKTENEMYAKQEKIEALRVKFEEQENDHKNYIADLEIINKKIIGEKDANIKELTSEVTKLKIDKDGNVKGPLTTITRLFPLAWQNSKGYNIGNIITLVRGDKPYSTTDNVDHYLYNLFQSIQEETGKTSTDAKKKYDKKYKSSPPYQQHISKNIPINKGNNNIARATMIEKNHNSNSNDKIFQTSLATVVPSQSTKKSKNMGGERKSKKHQKQKKHNNTKKQKINKTKK